MAVVKSNLAKCMMPKDPEVTRADVDRWDANVKQTAQHEELINRMQREMEDIPRIKADVLNILKV